MNRYFGVAVAALLILGACGPSADQQAKATVAATTAPAATTAAATAAPTTAAPATTAPAVSAGPATVALKSFAFSDGAVFSSSLAGKSTTLAFGDAGGTFALASGDGQATGGNVFGSCILTITASTFPAATHPELQVGKTITLSPCEVAVNGTLNVRNGSITVSSAPAVALASPTPTATPTAAATQTATQAPTQAPTNAPTQAPTATPTPTPTPTPSPTPSPSPSPSAAAGDGGWPTIVSHPIQSNEAPITGRLVHTNGTAAGHYCIILTSGPCAVTTDANGNFSTSFATLFLGPIDLVIKGPYNPATGDGPVVTVVHSTMTAQGITAGTITIP
jgi:hypothetical protein